MRKVVLFILLVCAFSQVAFAQAPADGLIDQAAQKSLTDKVDQLFAQWDKADSPGCALGVIRNGQFVYKRGYGMANLEYNIPISPTTIFWIASTSKQFTAMSIAAGNLWFVISVAETQRTCRVDYHYGAHF